MPFVKGQPLPPRTGAKTNKGKRYITRAEKEMKKCISNHDQLGYLWASLDFTHAELMKERLQPGRLTSQEVDRLTRLHLEITRQLKDLPLPSQSTTPTQAAMDFFKQVTVPSRPSMTSPPAEKVDSANPTKTL